MQARLLISRCWQHGNLRGRAFSGEEALARHEPRRMSTMPSNPLTRQAAKIEHAQPAAKKAADREIVNVPAPPAGGSGSGAPNVNPGGSATVVKSSSGKELVEINV